MSKGFLKIGANSRDARAYAVWRLATGVEGAGVISRTALDSSGSYL